MESRNKDVKSRHIRENRAINSQVLVANGVIRTNTPAIHTLPRSLWTSPWQSGGLPSSAPSLTFLRFTRALQPAFISSVLAVKGRDELAALALDRSAPLQTPRGVTGFAKKKFVFKGAKT